MTEEFEAVLRSQIRPAEKNKKINDFIRNVSAGDVDNILSTLKTDPTLVSAGIQLKLAKTFKRADLVIQILQGSNVSCINQAVKLQWMYQEGSLFENPGYLIDNLFPTCSYSCRHKIITSIGTFMKDEEKVNEIFKTIEKKYGFYTALPLLKACSKVQVTTILMSRRLKLGDDQLLRLAKKFPDVAINYLREIYTKKAVNNVPNYNATLKLLVDVVPKDFMKLLADFPTSVRYSNLQLGTRRSKKILRINHHPVIEIPGYASALRIPRVRKELTWEQYKTLLLTLVNKSTNYFADHFIRGPLWNWMKILSTPKKIEILENAYSDKFKKPMHECAEHLTSNMIAILPDDLKLKVIEWKIENKQGMDHFRLDDSNYTTYGRHMEGFWTTMKPIHLSVPELKQLFYMEQDVTLRGTLARFLILTCVVNKNTKELTAILELLNKRCRNDQKNVRYEVLDGLGMAVKYLDLEKQNWDIIYEFLQLIQLYHELVYGSNDIKTILQVAIAYHLNNKFPIDGWMGLFVALLTSEEYCAWDLDISLIKYPLNQKKFLEDFIVGLSKACPVKKEEPYSDTILDGIIKLIKLI